jgi:hypothetical protein
MVSVTYGKDDDLTGNSTGNASSRSVQDRGKKTGLSNDSALSCQLSGGGNLVLGVFEFCRIILFRVSICCSNFKWTFVNFGMEKGLASI